MDMWDQVPEYVNEALVSFLRHAWAEDIRLAAERNARPDNTWNWSVADTFEGYCGGEDLVGLVREIVFDRLGYEWKEVGDGVALNSPDSYGGEGMGDEYWYVFGVRHPEHGERFFKVPGYYASYDGGYYEFEDVREVQPVQVMVTEWESKGV